MGIAPVGPISAGGTCRLLLAADNRWFAINLARSHDREAIGAWMGKALAGPIWDAVASHARTVSAHEAVARARLLDIPAAVAAAPPSAYSPVSVHSGGPVTSHSIPVVLDLSALWAGPLCGRILSQNGARVIKVEFSDRPDGARSGAPQFWDQLNGAKEHLVINRDSAQLQQLLDSANVIITSARPRAVDALSLDLTRRVKDNGLLWVSITGYGYYGNDGNRVAFGDDAAVAGGLAVAAGGLDTPIFVGDAVADPLAGLFAAHAVVSRTESRGAMIDVSMRDSVAAALNTFPRSSRNGSTTGALRYATTKQFNSVEV